MLSCKLIPMMRISRRSCLSVEDLAPDETLNLTDLVDERGERFVEAPFDHRTYILIEVSLRVFAIGTLALFGVISNLINLVVFYRQGILSSSPTVSFTALAVSDFFCCFFNVWGAICGALMSFTDVSNYEWDISGFLIFTAVRPLDMFTQITCWVTAFTSFERLISVAFPFVVKAVFTPKRSLAALACIFSMTLILYIPNSFEEMPVRVMKRSSNLTFLGWDKSGLRLPNIRRVFFFTSPVILRFTSILVVLLCNIVIFWKVNLSQKFRKAATPPSLTLSRLNKSTKGIASMRSEETQPESLPLATAPTNASHGKRDIESHRLQHKKDTGKTKKHGSSTAANTMTTATNKTTTKTTKNTTTTNKNNAKEMRLLRMITVISAVFVFCYTMNAVYVIVYYVIWKWGVDYHGYVDYTAWLVVTFFQTANSSTNILIYDTMSTKFKQDLHALCSRTGSGAKCSGKLK